MWSPKTFETETSAKETGIADKEVARNTAVERECFRVIRWIWVDELRMCLFCYDAGRHNRIVSGKTFSFTPFLKTSFHPGLHPPINSLNLTVPGPRPNVLGARRREADIVAKGSEGPTISPAALVA
jgi:hypothetical protein